MFTMNMFIIIASHLSDVQELTQGNEEVRKRCNFVKYLLNKYRNNSLEHKIDPDEEWKLFLEEYPNNK